MQARHQYKGYQKLEVSTQHIWVQDEKGIHYDQTYGPVASWNSIRLILILSSVNKWKMVQLDCIMVFSQAPVQKELYMKITKEFQLDNKGDTI